MILVKEVLILGAGELGQAMAKVLLAKSNISVEMWDKDKSRVLNQRLLSEAVVQARFLFLCLPTRGYREVLKEIVEADLKSETIVVSFAKGLEEKTHKTTNELLKELLPKNQPFVLISGPMLAEEIGIAMFGAGLAASDSQEHAGAVIDLFSGTNLKLQYSNDVLGVAWIGVLKNIYSIGLGIAQALNLGDNFRGWYTGKAILEISEIVKILGGDPKTVLTPNGIGDLIATGFSQYSQNHELGKEIVKNGTKLIHSEGLFSLASVLELLGDRALGLMLLLTLKSIIVQGNDAKECFGNLLSNNGY